MPSFAAGTARAAIQWAMAKCLSVDRRTGSRRRLRLLAMTAVVLAAGRAAAQDIVWTAPTGDANPGILAANPDDPFAQAARNILAGLPPGEDALSVAQRLRPMFGDDPALLWKEAQSLHRLRRFQAAMTLYARLQTLSDVEMTVREQLVAAARAARRGEFYVESFRDCDECPEMVVVPAGSFTMGSPKREDGRDSDKGSQRRVTIPAPFAVGRFEVTFDEWDACVRDRGCDDSGPQGAGGDNSWGRGRRPVIEVSWDDAKTYVAWLSRKTGEPYRLLSEAEWEYVARAGTTTAFWTGGTISTDQANYNGNDTYGSGSKGQYKRRTVPVGGLNAPNPFGLHDVHGNVWEWVEDCWHGNYTGAPSDGSAWTTGGGCSRRVLRGGSWINLPRDLRSANRDWNDTGRRFIFNGFRVARTL